jgi:hypothetical protein
MPGVGFEPTIPVFQRANIFRALDCVVIVTGYNKHMQLAKRRRKNENKNFARTDRIVGRAGCVRTA